MIKPKVEIELLVRCPIFDALIPLEAGERDQWNCKDCEYHTDGWWCPETNKTVDRKRCEACPHQKGDGEALVCGSPKAAKENDGEAPRLGIGEHPYNWAPKLLCRYPQLITVCTVKRGVRV